MPGDGTTDDNAALDTGRTGSINAQLGGIAAHHIDHVEYHSAPNHHVQWPLLIGLIPQEADWFQDRRILDVQTEVEDQGANSRAPCRILTGPGGVGKTQAAAHYAREMWECAAVDLLIWVSAAERGAILSAYAEAAASAAITDPAEPEQAAARLLTWLATTRKRWLVVLDDLVDPSVMRDLWPPARSTGQVLVTTRRRDSALSRQGRTLIEVGLFEPDQATAYLAGKLSAPGAGGDPRQIAALAEELGFLPLALAQAAAYMTDLVLDTADYRQRLADRRRTLPDVFPDDGGLPDNHKSTLAATWSLSVGRANELRPAGLAQPMLELCSVLDANGIPGVVLTSQPALAYLAAHRAVPPREADPNRTGLMGPLVSGEDAADALRCLHRLSLIEHTPDSPDRAVRVHNLTQRATREPLPADRRGALVRAAADALNDVWPKIERDTLLTRALRACTDALASYADALLWQPRGHRVLFRAGHSLSEAGLVSTALAYWRSLYQVADQILGPDHPDTLLVRNHLARRQGQAGDPAGAAAALDSLITDMARVLGADHAYTLATRASLASRLGEAGDPVGAVATLEAVIVDMVRALGRDHTHALTARNNLAYWRAQRGEISDIPRPDIQTSPNSSSAQVPGVTRSPQSPDVTFVWVSRRGDPDIGLRRSQETLDRVLVDHGPDNALAFECRESVAHWRGLAGDPQGAIGDLEILLVDCARLLGARHHYTRAVRVSLAHWRTEAGEREGAEAILRSLREEEARAATVDATTRRMWVDWLNGKIDSRIVPRATIEGLFAKQLQEHGPDHPRTLAIRASLAHSQGRAGDPAAAALVFERILGDCIRILGPDHANTLAAQAGLAHWRGEAGDPAQAAATFEVLLDNQLRIEASEGLPPGHHAEANWSGGLTSTTTMDGLLLTGQLEVLGLDRFYYLDTFTTRESLAHWRGLAGDPLGAASALEELLADQLRVLGPSHPTTLITRNNLARWLGEAGDPDTAWAATVKIVQDYVQILGPDHPNTLATRNNLAHWLGQIGYPSAAASALEDLLADYLRVLGREHSSTLIVRNNLARWRGAAGDPAAACAALEALLAEYLLLLGPEHPATLNTRNNLANWRGEAGRPTTAAEELDALLTDCSRILGPNHPHTVNVRSNLAQWRDRAGLPEPPAGQRELYLTNHLTPVDLGAADDGSE